jgi:predicted DNA-binding transcriptional regulator YafY
VLELQRHGQRRAEDLAATFGVSQRTIYRDVQALAETGIPLISMTGQGYSLMEGYFLPPVNFTTDEALMLLLGSDIMRQNFDAQYKQAAADAAVKIESVLPERLRRELVYLRQNITMFVMKKLDAQKLLQLSQIRRAIIERRMLRVVYMRRFADDGKETPTIRQIAPYSLASLEHDWYLMAYCYLREEIRVFRLSRIDQLNVLPEQFERPHNFTPNWEVSNRPRHIIVKIRVADTIIRWVRESRPYSLIQEEPIESSWLLTFRVQQEDELLRWILGWGRHVEVLEPESLRDKLVEETRHILDMHDPQQT